MDPIHLAFTQNSFKDPSKLGQTRIHSNFLVRSRAEARNKSESFREIKVWRRRLLSLSEEMCHRLFTSTFPRIKVLTFTFSTNIYVSCYSVFSDIAYFMGIKWSLLLCCIKAVRWTLYFCKKLPITIFWGPYRPKNVSRFLPNWDVLETVLHCEGFGIIMDLIYVIIGVVRLQWHQHLLLLSWEIFLNFLGK